MHPQVFSVAFEKPLGRCRRHEKLLVVDKLLMVLTQKVPAHEVPSHEVPSHEVPSHEVPSHEVPAHDACP
jgi:hypothetical protein